MKKILLHACCAPCSAAVLEWLIINNFQPTVLYYNPNIFPHEEYKIRKTELTRYTEKLGVKTIDGDYNHEKWLKHIAGLEQEKERGNRCLACFRMRMLASAQQAESLQIPLFATTLASSRWKNLAQIDTAGLWAAEQVKNVAFFQKNWRKDGLQERRNVLLAKNNFYNQPYCGCEFSVR